MTAWSTKAEAPARAFLRFAAVSLASYYVVMWGLFLKVPIYSTAKASYTAGLTPCYAALAAAGLATLARGRVLRAVLCAALACWASAAFWAYFVV
jgi:hypothetical protein